MLLNNVLYDVTLLISSSVMYPNSIAMTTDRGLSYYWILMAVELIILMGLREILSASNIWSESLNDSFDLAISPLALVFIFVAIYKAFEVL
jgi:hypothetical protein